MEERKIPFFNSLGAKLFYYMTSLVLITIAGNSYQNFKVFSQYLSDQAAESMVSRAETTISQVQAQIDMWKSQVGTFVPTFFGTKNDFQADLDRFIESNADFVAMSVYKSPTKTSKSLSLLADTKTKNTTDARLEDKVLESIVTLAFTEAKKAAKSQIKVLNKTTRNTFVYSLAKKTGLPLMLVATRFESTNSPEVLWSLLICWQSPIIKVLPKSAYVDSAIIDSKAKVFSSNTLDLMKNLGSFSTATLSKEAVKANRISNFVPEYKNAKDRRVIGGFARLPQYGLTVLVEEDIEHAYEELNRNMYRTLLWAGLFILIAIMFSYIGASRITKNLRTVAFATQKIATGDFNHTITINSKDEISALADSVNTMSSEIVTLMKDNLVKAEMESELSTAKMVQSAFFPKRDFISKSLQVTGFYQPATQCGGDLWGHYEIAENMHLIYIADAMGHGVPAALVTAIAYSVGATIANSASQRNQPTPKPSEFLDHINKVIFDAIGGSFSMTFFCAIIDCKTGKMLYSNGGHNFPFLIPGSVDGAKGLTPTSIKLMGNPLGMYADTTFKNKEMQIQPGDKIFLFTDGLIECSSPNGEVWGRKILLSNLADSAHLSFDHLKDDILSKAFTLFAGKPINDDVTVVVAEIPKDWSFVNAEVAPLLEAAPVQSPMVTINEIEVFDEIRLADEAVPEREIQPLQLKKAETTTEQKEQAAERPKGRYKIKLPSAS